MFANALYGLSGSVFVAGVYELAGRGWALIGASVVLGLLALAVEGLNPIKLTLAAVHDVRVKLTLWRAERKAERRTRRAAKTV